MGEKLFTVTKKGLLGRINRVLDKESLRMKITRRVSRSFENRGRYYIIDMDTKMIVDHPIPLEIYVGDLGVLNTLEYIKD